MSLFDLTGKKALVTGASRGLGYAMAEGLLEHGADVVIVSSSEKIFSAAAQLGKNRVNSVIPLQANLGNREQLKRAFEASVQKLGTLDILLVSHGIQRRHNSEVFPLNDWADVIEVNLTSMFLLDQLAGQVMLPKGQGKIINIASLQSFIGGWRIPAYAAAKGGVARMTMTLANEWAARGVNVNAIAPGYMDTDMNEALKNDAARYQSILGRIPAGRWGNADDMKGTAVFLASEASNYVNGVILPVDGGWLGR